MRRVTANYIGVGFDLFDLITHTVPMLDEEGNCRDVPFFVFTFIVLFANFMDFFDDVCKLRCVILVMRIFDSIRDVERVLPPAGPLYAFMEDCSACFQCGLMKLQRPQFALEVAQKDLNIIPIYGVSKTPSGRKDGDIRTPNPQDLRRIMDEVHRLGRIIADKSVAISPGEETPSTLALAD